MNLNKAFVLGNLTRDPEVRSLPSGQQVTSFSIATNRVYTDASGQKKEEAEFHNIVCFGKLADIASRYLTKGGMVLIEGRLKTRTWQDQSGHKNYKTEIIAELLQLGPKGLGNTNPKPYSKPFQTQEQEPENSKSEEIPVIQEDYNPPAENSKPSETTYQGDAADEIDVRDIPF